jgi:hypothetical protein
MPEVQGGPLIVAREHAIEHLMDLAGYFSGFRENKGISKRNVFEIMVALSS